MEIKVYTQEKQKNSRLLINDLCLQNLDFTKITFRENLRQFIESITYQKIIGFPIVIILKNSLVEYYSFGYDPGLSLRIKKALKEE